MDTTPRRPERDRKNSLSRPETSRVDPGVGEPSDDEILRGLQSSDPAAFEAAYTRHRAPLYSFLVRLTGRRWLAEDLLQETWLRLSRSAPDLPADTRLRAWLFTVARNLFVSHRRWTLLDADRLRQLGMLPTSASESPFEQAAANQTQTRLERALASLPVDAREVLLLVAVERLEPSEAASIVGLRPDALRQRLSRARAMLSERLEREERKRP
jgi:RNA polymerase sigma-70 factor (ECF subfamily)